MVVHDDMLDGALVRRGRPCWHTLKDVGVFAVSDFILLIHCGYYILQQFSRDLSAYPRLFESIANGVFSTHMGQTMDFVGMGNVNDFSLPLCRKAQTCIVADFLFYTPLSMLFALVGYISMKDPILLWHWTDSKLFSFYRSFQNPESIKHICDEMGHYHQCQNDLLDVFNIDGILHKTGHDIEINKCSWLSCACIERANGAQIQIMIDNYGKNGDENRIYIYQTNDCRSNWANIILLSNFQIPNVLHVSDNCILTWICIKCTKNSRLGNTIRSMNWLVQLLANSPWKKCYIKLTIYYFIEHGPMTSPEALDECAIGLFFYIIPFSIFCKIIQLIIRRVAVK